MEWNLSMIQKINNNIPFVKTIIVKDLIEGIRMLRNKYINSKIILIKTDNSLYLAIKCYDNQRARIIETLDAVVENKKYISNKLASI